MERSNSKIKKGDWYMKRPNISPLLTSAVVWIILLIIASIFAFGVSETIQKSSDQCDLMPAEEQYSSVDVQQS